ncbi:MAG: hypothetical protein JST50_20545 [Bacteroidetes bacterium]|jgi:hypothetical protein|nr:hypothetical protein [Bacteroidota bacterium]
MKIKYLSIIALSLALFVVSCKKDKATGPSHKDLNAPVDVYAAGWVLGGPNGAPITAAYWKNGILTVLGDTTSNVNNLGSIARGIAVSGNDVYVSGVVYTANYGYAVVWKNGVQIKLSPDSNASEAGRIAINGSDVYVLGYIHDILSQSNTDIQYSENPIYWKNGVPYTIPNATAINSIFANGNDVYIGGSVKSAYVYPSGTNAGLHGSKAAYWKNNEPLDSLNSGQSSLPYNSSQIDAITANNTGVYAAGSSESYPLEYWANGQPAELSGDAPNSIVTGIAANGSDVYISGIIYSNGDNHAVYWKNNQETILQTDLTDPQTGSTANDIALNGTDVYVAGEANLVVNNAPEGAYIWKNGVYTKLPGGSKGGAALSIAIVPKP